ncbi:hypothetical protein BG006_010016 [Podila minutissima]|uniref:C3H1-type domain-containing protein n=1 Tax=Podila minutissima TaxID=64525 RepID=A0A9P5VJ13_9FUNG|nr:hypothetical protein BG006_010016 [Podila minutissima]
MYSQGDLFNSYSCNYTYNSHPQNLSRRSSLPFEPLPNTFGRSCPGTKSSDSSRRSSLGDTGMEVESAILFNVNPPSPQGSDYHSDDQDTILRTWHAGGGPLVEQPQYSHSMPHHLAEKGYCGIITPYEYAASFDPDSINTLAKNPAKPPNMCVVPSQDLSQYRRSSLPLRGSLAGGFSAGEGSSNVPSGYPRKGPPPPGRRGPGESNRKSELYKTELCISLSTGNPCRYGDQCQFAHSKEELQHVNRHPRYKTQFCMSFQSHGYCKYNERCTFIHHPEEARVPWESIVGCNGNTEDSTSIQTPGSISSAKDPRADRTRALSDPGFASASSTAEELTDGGRDSDPYHETRRRSNVVYPPDLLYKLAHPQMAQFTEREHTPSAFPLAMERESMMACESIMRENLAMARESMRESMANVANVESIMTPLGAMNLSAVLETPKLTPQLQVPKVPQMKAPQAHVRQVQVLQAQIPQAQVSQAQVPQIQAPQIPIQASTTPPPGLYPPMAPPKRRLAPTEDPDEVDEQWARAMAAYISTSDNEFEM